MTQPRRISPSSILLVTLIVAPILYVGSCLGYKAFEARRPKDMPPNSIWINAPAVPFGFYRGWWEGCSLTPDQTANYCRLSARDLHPPTVYEGRFMPCNGASPAPLGELDLKPPQETGGMWIFPGFVAFLRDGRILVPLENLGDCRKILDRIAGNKNAALERTN